MATKRKRFKVSVSDVKKRNPPLAKIVQILHEGKTNRDAGSAASLSQDIAIALNALDKDSALGRAFEEFVRTTDLPISGTIEQGREAIEKVLKPAVSRKASKKASAKGRTTSSTSRKKAKPRPKK